MAWALGVAATLAFGALVWALTVRRARRVAAVAAAAFAMCAVGIGAVPHLSDSMSADDPASRVALAAERVASGELDGGCMALAQSLAVDRTVEHRVEGASDAVMACVEHRIDAALAVAEPLERERALLGVASADAPLTPTTAQFQRIAREVARVPGAEKDGVGRVRIRSYEIRGPLPTKPLRAHTRDQLIRLRGCHARAWQQGRGIDGEVKLTLSIDAGGRVGRAAADGLDARFHSCLEAAFVGAELGPTDAPSRAIVAIDLEPG